MPNLLTGQEIMTFLQRLQGLADNKICAFAWFVVRRFDEERVPQAAASMTFTTLLALVPVLTVMVAVASIFPVFDRWSDSFVSFVNQTIVPQGADMVFDYINAFREQANRLTAIGSVMLVVTSLMLIRTIDNTFNRIWRVNSQRPWMMQFLVYWALLTFGPLSLGVGISFMVGSVQDAALASGAPQWSGALRTAATLTFMTLLLWGLYRFVPNRFVPARQAFVGGFGNSVLSGNRALPLHLVYGQFRRLPLDLRRVCRRAVFSVVAEPVVDAGLGRRGADFFTLLLAGRSVPQGLRLARTV